MIRSDSRWSDDIRFQTRKFYGRKREKSSRNSKEEQEGPTIKTISIFEVVKQLSLRRAAGGAESQDSKHHRANKLFAGST